MHDLLRRLQDQRHVAKSLKLNTRLAIAAACLVLVLQGCAQPPAFETGVFVIGATGASTERLGAPAGAPVWSPSGDAVAWATEDGLYLRHLSESEPTRISPRVAAGRPAWSPDAAAIALIDREAESLVVIEPETRGTRFEVDIATPDARHRPLALPVLGGPSWSPDGTRLAFTCWDGQGDETCVVAADGSGYRQVTHIQSRDAPGAPATEALVPAASNTGPPAWSPSGTEIALAVYPEQRGAAAGVFVVDLEAGTARRVSTLLPNSEIAWIANGTSLLFSARDQGRTDALRIPVAGGEPERLTASLEHGGREPALSPDQTRLAVVSAGAIVVLDADGNVGASIAGEGERRLPAWSPAGDWIAFAADPDPLASYS